MARVEVGAKRRTRRRKRRRERDSIFDKTDFAIFAVELDDFTGYKGTLEVGRCGR